MATEFSGRGGDRSYSGLAKSFGRVGGPGYIPFAGASEAAPKPGQVHQSMRTKAAKKAQAARKPLSAMPSGPVTVRRVPPTVPKGTRQAKLGDISVSGGKGNSRILTRSFATRPAESVIDNPAVYPRTRIEDAIKEDSFEPTPRPKSVKTQVAEATEKRRRRFDRERSLRVKASKNTRQYPLSHSEKVDRAKRITTNINNARAKLASKPVLTRLAKSVGKVKGPVVTNPSDLLVEYLAAGRAARAARAQARSTSSAFLRSKSVAPFPGTAGRPNLPNY